METKIKRGYSGAGDEEIGRFDAITRRQIHPPKTDFFTIVNFLNKYFLFGFRRGLRHNCISRSFVAINDD